MPRIEKQDAERCLKEGALGIGEDHTEPDARQLAIDLILSGHVTHLFVELAHTHFGTALQGAQEIAEKGGSLDEIQKASPDGNLFTNKIPLSRVIATALHNKVAVHFADHPIMASRAGDFERRHGSILAVFRAVSQQPEPDVANAVGASCAGCLFLWGADHFLGNKALEKFILNLPYVDTTM